MAAAEGKKVPSVSNNAITSCRWRLSTRLCDVDSRVSSAVKLGVVGVLNEADKGVFWVEFDRLKSN